MKKSPLEFVNALLVISNQICFYGDQGLRDHIIEDVMKMFSIITKEAEIEVNEDGYISDQKDVRITKADILMFIMEAVYKLSLHEKDSRKASMLFSDLMEKVFNISPLLVEKFQ